MNPIRELARTHELLRRGQLAEAEAACRGILAAAPGNADALHLLGLIRKQRGDADGAEQHLAASVVAAPGRADFRHNLANLLRARGKLPAAESAYRAALAINSAFRPARLGLAGLYNELGRHAEAETEARRLVAVDAGDVDAQIALGIALRGQQRFAESEGAYRAALQAAPDNLLARHNLGALLGQLERAEESLVELDRAAAAGLRGRELAHNRGRALTDLYRFDEAEQAFAAAVAAAPGDADSHLQLAKLRHMRGDADFARSLREAAALRANDAGLRLTYADVLRRGGDREGAEAVLRQMLHEAGRQPVVLASLGTLLHEMGRVAEALQCFREAHRGGAPAGAPADAFVAALLSAGEPAEAMPIILRERERVPLDQGWLAHLATAARLMGSAEYERLYDYERLVLPIDLSPPPGWSTIEAFHADLVPALEARHRFEAHPLDQSLRGGTQTARNLLFDPDPVIQAFLRTLREPIEAYRAALGYDPGHPLRARNRGEVRLAGCWSVRLRRGGFHVNHVHPEGWISSAYYVSVPPEVTDADTRSGWIKFGEPRLPVPGAPPAKFVQPKAGRLVLFPSYMWHGTTPITGDEPRMTIAFDVVPVTS
jgi:tetratricopeptide (TPR) repeat protein